MSDEPTTGRLLTPRSQARLDAGATEGAGTHVCVKCAGPKEAGRVNSDKCKACNTVPSKAASPSRRGSAVTSAVAVPFPDAMLDALKTEAERRDMTLFEYIENGMRRVLKKDAGWVAPSLTGSFTVMPDTQRTPLFEDES